MSYTCEHPLEREMMMALRELLPGYVPEYYQQLAVDFVDIALEFGAKTHKERTALDSPPLPEITGVPT